MRLHRFFVPIKIGDRKTLAIDSADLVNQVRRVFRLKPGDAIVVFDGSGKDYECTIAGFDGMSIMLNVSAQKSSRFESGRKIILMQAVIKKDLFEKIVQGATELGVTEIVPILAERSEKKNLNASRLEKIAREASEQSGRGNVPALNPVLGLEDAIDLVKKRGVGNPVVFHTDGRTPENFASLKAGSAAIFIGPEGGWSPGEMEMFHKNGISSVCLGKQILRAETAAIAALSLIAL